MKKIKINGLWLSEEQEIKRGVVRAYQNLLSDLGCWHLSLNGLECDRIEVEEAVGLEVFSVEEVYSTLSELKGDKTPGPNEFTLAF